MRIRLEDRLPPKVRKDLQIKSLKQIAKLYETDASRNSIFTDLYRVYQMNILHYLAEHKEPTHPTGGIQGEDEGANYVLRRLLPPPEQK